MHMSIERSYATKPITKTYINNYVTPNKQAQYIAWASNLQPYYTEQPYLMRKIKFPRND